MSPEFRIPQNSSRIYGRPVRCQFTDHGVLPWHGDVLVSGATGGVGSIAVAILAQMGYSVVAVNGLVDRIT